MFKSTQIKWANCPGRCIIWFEFCWFSCFTACYQASLMIVGGIFIVLSLAAVYIWFRNHKDQDHLDSVLFRLNFLVLSQLLTFHLKLLTLSMPVWKLSLSYHVNGKVNLCRTQKHILNPIWIENDNGDFIWICLQQPWESGESPLSNYVHAWRKGLFQ